MRKALKETYNWYNTGGKTFIERYTNVGDYVKNYFETNGTKEVSGVYMILFNEVPVAIGESSQMGVRFMEHMKNLEENGKELFGVNMEEIKNGKITIKIEILKTGLLNEADRIDAEISGINEYQPIFQIKYDKYYPKDKAQKQNDRWLLRQDIREDQYIRRIYRRERLEEFIDL